VIPRRLKNIAIIAVSNVDKKSTAGDWPVHLCNYVDVYNNERITSDLPFMEATATPEQVRQFHLRAGDVLVTKDSETPDDIAVPAYVAEEMPQVVCGYHLAIVRPRAGTHGRYLFWALSSNRARQQFSAMANGITRFGLRREALADVRVPLPERPVQRAIADYLDAETARIDALIEKKRRMVELLESAFRSYRWEMVARGIGDLGGALGRPTATLQAGWTPVRLRHLVEEAQGGAWGSEIGDYELDVECYRVADFDRWVNTAAAKAPTMRSIPREQFKRIGLAPDDLLLEKSGGGDTQPVGFVARFVGSENPSICSNFVARLRVKPRHHPRFVAEVFAAIYDSGLTIPFVKQTTGIQNLDVDAFLSQHWAVPGRGEQERLASCIQRELARVGALRESIKRQLELLAEQRQALITAAVTGELDIPGLAA